MNADLIMAGTFGFGHDWLGDGAFEELLFIELMDCCFSGADENNQTNGGNELIFPVYPVLPCRDTMQRSRTNSCYLNSNHFQQSPVVSPVDHDSNVPYNISVD
ncbi:hypothetical protein GBA52_013434 [Prunus armeniaca]|nr:hypothetical protein GBA52_013434 [Prunus armeniaca]